MKFVASLPKTVQNYIKIYCLGLFFFSIFRILIFINQFDKIKSELTLLTTLKSFLMGIRFDSVVACYIVVLPFFFETITSFFKKKSILITHILFAYIVIMFGIAFLVCAIDIPYFNYFYSRFSISAFEWLATPDIVFKMILQEPKYWAALLPLFLVLYIFFRVSKPIVYYKQVGTNPNKLSSILTSIFVLAFLFLGIRGSITPKSPIRISTAYFCENSFLNQLGLNPNFTLLRSYIESTRKENQFITLMDNKKAVAMVQKNMGIYNPNHPFARAISVQSDSPVNKYNVVLIIMESMSVAKTGIHGNKKNLTPFLDSLSTKGLYFENTYSAGIHTYNGIYSTLFSYPALFRQHPMREASISKHQSIFSTLRKHGYSTIYFTNHDGFFDNVEGFLTANDCQQVITEANYPKNEIKTAFGVPDDFMFRFSIPLLNSLAKKNKPFIATFMTTSDHSPYYIPIYYKPKAKEEYLQATQYADYSLQKMMQMASKQAWFDNTLFVFVADHGMAMDQVYDMPLTYNHIPMLFYAPKLIRNPQKISKMASQIDVYPTIMGLLNLPYQNTTLGINILKENRPYSYFNGDDKYGVIDKNWFLMVRNDKSNFLYKYQSKDKTDYAKQYPEVVTKMNDYAKSNLQSYQYYLQQKR